MKVRDNVDYTNRDYAGLRQDMIQRLQQLIPEYTDTSDSDAGIVLIDLLAHGLDILSYYNDKVANEVFLATARERSSVMMIAQGILGYEIQENTPSKVYQVFEIIPTEDDTIIPAGTLLRTKGEYGESSLYFELDTDLIIPAKCTGLEKDEKGEYLYKVSCTQGYTVEDDVLGSSDGTANQTFTVPRSGVIKDSVIVSAISENGMTEEWTRVSNFINSSPLDKHYTVTLDENNVATVHFGNGRSGKIPAVHVDGLTVTYRIGGGTVGNVAPRVINRTDENLAYVKSTFNPAEPYLLGVDRETLEEIKLNASSSFKTQWSCITTEDYADILKGQEYVLDAYSYSEKSKPLDITVYVLPKNYGDMNDDTLKQLRKSLEEVYLSKKALGVTVSIKWAKIQYVTLNLDITLEETASKAMTRSVITDTLFANYNLDTRKIGEPMYLSRILSDVLDIEGVLDVTGYLDDNKAKIIPTEPGTVTALQTINTIMNGGVV